MEQSSSAFRDNPYNGYLDVTQGNGDEEFESEDMSSFALVDHAFREYISLNCSCCGAHFGYQHREDLSFKLCTPRCLSVVSHQLRKLGTTSVNNLENDGRSFSACPSRSASRIGMRSTCMPCIGDGQSDIRSANVPTVMTQIPAQINPHDHLSPQVNHIGNSHEIAVESRELEKKEQVFRSARDGPRLVKPSSRVHVLNDDALAPKTLRTLPTNYRVEAEQQHPPQKQPLGAVPCRAAGTSSMERTPEPEMRTVTIPGPSPVVAASTTKPILKKIWKFNEVTPSSALVNLAACTIGCVWGPTKFTVNASADMDKMEKLKTDIEEYSATAPPLNRVPAVGDIIFVPFQGDFVAFRGRVDKVDETKGEVDIAFIDYGDLATIKLAECREPCDKIMQDNPVYGMTFTLKLNVPSPPKFQLSDEIMAEIDGNTFYLYQESATKTTSEWTGSGTLFFNKEGNKSLNYLIEQCIQTQNVPEQSKPVVAKSETTAKVAPTSALPKASVPETAKRMPVDWPTPTEVKTKTVRSAINPFAIGNRPQIRKTIQNSPCTDSLVTGAVVHINFIWNDGMVSISSLEDDSKLEILADLVKKRVATAPRMSRKPDIDEIVIAPYMDSHFRGRVTAVTEDKVRVTFVDYGDDTEVSYKELTELNEEIAKCPIYGSVFHMFGIPKTQRITVTDALSVAAETPGQIDILEKGLGEMMGNLWVSKDRTWRELIKAAHSTRPINEK